MPVHCRSYAFLELLPVKNNVLVRIFTGLNALCARYPGNRMQPPSPSGSAPAAPSPKKAAQASWIGSAVEYYDFFIYSTAPMEQLGQKPRDG